MKEVFLKDFYNGEPETTLIDLISIKQNANESPLDYVNRWMTTLRICKERIPQELAVGLCRRGFQATIGSKLAVADIKNFSELSDKVKRLMSIKELYGKQVFDEDDQEGYVFQGNVQSSMFLRKERRMVNAFHAQKNSSSTNSRSQPKRRPLTFEEATGRPYSFPKDRVKELFNSLMQGGCITLPKLKRPDEEHMTNHPRFCAFHRMVGHAIEDCIPLKNKLERMIQNNEVEINGAIRVSPPRPHETSPRFKKNVLSINVTTLHDSAQSSEEGEEQALPQEKSSSKTSEPFSAVRLVEEVLSVKDLITTGMNDLKNCQTYFDIYEAAQEIAQCAKVMLRSIEMHERLISQDVAHMKTKKKSSPTKVKNASQQRKTSSTRFREAMSRPYSFPRDLVKKLFNSMMEAKVITTLEPKRPNEAHLTTHPNFCPYHQMLGHKIEDCITFKNTLERMIHNDEVEINENILVKPPKPHDANPTAKAVNVTSMSMHLAQEFFILPSEGPSNNDSKGEDDQDNDEGLGSIYPRHPCNLMDPIGASPHAHFTDLM